MRIDITAHVYLHDTAQLDRIEKLVLKHGDSTMSAISDFAAKQKAYNERMDAAVSGLASDVKSLNDKISAIQNSAGTISAEDQATLDQLQAQGEALAGKLEALDGLTPPRPSCGLRRQREPDSLVNGSHDVRYLLPAQGAGSDKGRVQ